jgi:hypothetical protein
MGVGMDQVSTATLVFAITVATLLFNMWGSSRIAARGEARTRRARPPSH